MPLSSPDLFSVNVFFNTESCTGLGAYVESDSDNSEPDTNDNDSDSELKVCFVIIQKGKC